MVMFSVIILLAVSMATSEDPLLVRTESGSVRGYYKTAFHGTIYRAFEGVPYAQPPVGKLRFQPPVPIRPWNEVINATSISEICIQCKTALMPKTIGSEDCLYMNIFAPILGMKDSLLPVIFYIHGGTFSFGSGADTGPGYLLDRKVIVITFNYRLGAMGWLSTEDDVVPGNMALKDQSLALRWVSKNIEAFGGNPSKILLTGHSSGAVNAHNQFLSPWSKGLFQRGITMSDTSLNCGGMMKGALKKSKKIASLVGCPIANTTIMVACLMSTAASDIVKTTPYIKELIAFGPVVERGGQHPFLNATPIEIMSRGEAADVPWITGVVSMEGLTESIWYSLNETVMNRINDKWDILAPSILHFSYTIPKNNQSYVANLIKEHYFGSDAISIMTMDTYATMLGDRMNKVDVVKAARIQAKANKSPVFFYYFTYRGARSQTDSFSAKDHGVAHCDDMAYIFEFANINTSTTAQDIAMREFLLDFWVSYATNGTPYVGIEWPRLNSSLKELQYLHIMGPHNVNADTCTNFAEEEFWSTINFNENVLEMPQSQGVITKISVLLYTICQLLLLI